MSIFLHHIIYLSSKMLKIKKKINFYLVRNVSFVQIFQTTVICYSNVWCSSVSKFNFFTIFIHFFYAVLNLFTDSCVDFVLSLTSWSCCYERKDSWFIRKTPFIWVFLNALGNCKYLCTSAPFLITILTVIGSPIVGRSRWSGGSSVSIRAHCAWISMVMWVLLWWRIVCILWRFRES